MSEAWCVECHVRPRRANARCETCARLWRRRHAAERCSYCPKITIDAHTGQRHGRRFRRSVGPDIITCRAHLPEFLNLHRAENLERLAQAITADPLPGCWLVTDPAQLNPDGYSLIVPRGAHVQLLGHHLAYALLVGGWKQSQQLHHRCQRPACLSSFHLEPLGLTAHASKQGVSPLYDPRPKSTTPVALDFAADHWLPTHPTPPTYQLSRAA